MFRGDDAGVQGTQGDVAGVPGDAVKEERQEMNLLACKCFK